MDEQREKVTKPHIRLAKLCPPLQLSDPTVSPEKRGWGRSGVWLLTECSARAISWFFQLHYLSKITGWFCSQGLENTDIFSAKSNLGQSGYRSFYKSAPLWHMGFWNGACANRTQRYAGSTQQETKFSKWGPSLNLGTYLKGKFSRPTLDTWIRNPGGGLSDRKKDHPHGCQRPKDWSQHCHLQQEAGDRS